MADLMAIMFRMEPSWRAPVTANRWLLAMVLLAVCQVLGGRSPAHARLDYSRIDYRTTTVYARGNDQWNMGAFHSTAGLSSEAFGWRLSLKCAAVLPNGDLRWGRVPSSDPSARRTDAGALSGIIFIQQEYFETVFSVASPDETVTTLLGWRHKTDDRDGLSAEIRLQPFRLLGGGVKFSREYPLPSYSELFYEFEDADGELAWEGGRINWRMPAHITETRLYLAPLNAVVFESRYRTARMRPQEPIAGESPFGTYLGVIDGKWDDSYVRAAYVMKSGWRATVGYRQIEVDTRLRAFDGGCQFAYFGILNAEGKQWSFELIRNDWRLLFFSGRARGEARGVIDAWPFLSGLLRFLGERRHFVGEAELDWKYGTAGGPVWRYRKLSLNAFFDYLRIHPDVKYVTWRPVIFGMGIDDLQREQWDLLRADLVRLGLKPAVQWNRWRVVGNISQWIPVATKKIDHGPQPDRAPGEKKESTWGGFNATVSVAVGF